MTYHTEQDRAFLTVLLSLIDPLDGERVTESSCSHLKADAMSTEIPVGLCIVPLKT